MIHAGGFTDREPGPDLVIDCPACGARGTPATTYDEGQTLLLLHLVPVWRDVQTFVTCSTCEQKLIAPLRAQSLVSFTSEELGQILRVHTSFVQKALAVLAVPISVAPLLGSLFAIIAILANWRSRRWPFTVSMYSLLMSAVFLVWTEPFDFAMKLIAG